MSWQDITGITIDPDPELDAFFLSNFSLFEITSLDEMVEDEAMQELNFDPFDPAYLEQARKRKSRWVTCDDAEGDKGTRRSRWRSLDESVSGLTRAQQILSTQTMRAASGSLTAQQQSDFLKLTQEVDTLTQKMANPQAYMPPAGTRSPSPEAVYDSTGKRVNTREQRLLEQLNSARNVLIERAMMIVPTYTVPGYKREKPHCRVRIPAEEFPEYNFPGLIIGPRGLAHRRLEAETGCKISIRGKGMTSDSQKNNQHMHEQPHVFIQGDTEEMVKNAEKVMKELQCPSELAKTYQQRQLREQAALHGLELGAKSAPMKELAPSAVMCTVCGSGNHITVDCPYKDQNQHLDLELDMFLTGLRGEHTLRSVNQQATVSKPVAAKAILPPRPPPPIKKTIPPPPPPPPPSSSATTAPPSNGPYGSLSHSHAIVDDSRSATTPTPVQTMVPPPPPPPPPTHIPYYAPLLTPQQQAQQAQKALMYSFIPPPDFG